MDELSTQLATILITNIFFTQIVGAFIPWLFSKVTLILGLAKDKKKLDKGVRKKKKTNEKKKKNIKFTIKTIIGNEKTALATLFQAG